MIREPATIVENRVRRRAGVGQRWNARRTRTARTRDKLLTQQPRTARGSSESSNRTLACLEIDEVPVLHGECEGNEDIIAPEEHQPVLLSNDIPRRRLRCRKKAEQEKHSNQSESKSQIRRSC